jgi:hypothetical protein
LVNPYLKGRMVSYESICTGSKAIIRKLGDGKAFITSGFL